MVDSLAPGCCGRVLKSEYPFGRCPVQFGIVAMMKGRRPMEVAGWVVFTGLVLMKMARGAVRVSALAIVMMMMAVAVAVALGCGRRVVVTECGARGGG